MPPTKAILFLLATFLQGPQVRAFVPPAILSTKLRKSRETIASAETAMGVGMSVGYWHEKSKISVTTKDILEVSNPMAVGCVAIHVSLLSLLDNFINGNGAAPNALAWFSSSGSCADSASNCLHGLSHLVLDCIALVGAPSMIGVRLASVAGHLFSLTSDYLPDHALAPEDWFLQLFALYLAFSGLIKSASHSAVIQFFFAPY